MEEKTYWFQPEMKMKNQGFIMTDENENVVYQAESFREKENFFKYHSYIRFINKFTNEEVVHKMDGISSIWGFKGDKSFASIAYNKNDKVEYVTSHTSVDFDGDEVWKYLIEKGIQIDYHDALSKLGKVSFLSGECTDDYDIYINGEKIANIIGRPPRKVGVYRYYANSFEIITSKMEEHADILFLITLVIEMVHTFRIDRNHMD